METIEIRASPPTSRLYERRFELDDEEILKLWREMPQLTERIAGLEKQVSESGDRIKRLETWLVTSLIMLVVNLSTTLVGILLRMGK